MERRDIKHLVESIRSIGIFESTSTPMPVSFKCTVFPPVRWNKRYLEEHMGVTIPHDLEQLWNETSGLRLFEDITYGQWGLVIWSPHEIISKQEELSSWLRKADLRTGDLIIGGFIGDRDLPIVRCDQKEADFGHVIIALEIYHREEWITAADSVIAFLERFLATQGDKFWEK